MPREGAGNSASSPELRWHPFPVLWLPCHTGKREPAHECPQLAEGDGETGFEGFRPVLDRVAIHSWRYFSSEVSFRSASWRIFAIMASTGALAGTRSSSE